VIFASQNSVLIPQSLAVAPRGQTAERRGMYAFRPLKLQSYWTEVHQILHNVARSSQTKMLKSKLQYSTPFIFFRRRRSGDNKTT